MRPGVAQSFFESPVPRGTSPSPSVQSNDTQLAVKEPCSCCCRCGRAQEWKPNGFRGKRRSRSFSPPRTIVSELLGWTDEPESLDESVELTRGRLSGPGESSLEKLPVEILGMSSCIIGACAGTNDTITDKIISQLALDVPPAEFTPRNEDLISCLLTSRTIHAATITTLYSHVTIPHSKVFSKFLGHITQYPGRGRIVRRLDLSHFTAVGMARSKEATQNIQNLTATTLFECLELTPNIQEVLLQEHVEDDLSTEVLQTLLFGLPNLKALDFCAASSAKFVEAFSSAVTNATWLNSMNNSTLGIRKLSLHECFTLPTSSLENLLPQLPRLTHLDLFHTRVNDKALMSIPKTARLTHLNLGRCSQISGAGTVDFLTSHPAAKELIYLNLACDLSRYRLLWETDVEKLLPELPSSLRSLNIGGAQIRSRHVQLLLPLSKHLEELGIRSADLTLKDVNSLFVPSSAQTDSSAVAEEQEPWIPSALRYIDLANISSITQPTLMGNACVLLSSVTSPLEVIELGDQTIAALKESTRANSQRGWVVKDLKRRGWFVRSPGNDGAEVGDRRRAWKMGAMWWGMRKIPVAWGEVGGMYGHYMFKR
jgi:hypothetical protein